MTITQILARSSWRFYSRHPSQLILSIVGIVLGVAIVTAVLITNHSSQKAFALSSEALFGRATHQITGANGIDQIHFVNLRKEFPHLAMAPVIEGHVVFNDSVYSLLGLDPFSEASFARTQISDEQTEQLKSTSQNVSNNLLTINNAVLANDIDLEKELLAVGQSLELNINGKLHTAFVAGGITTPNASASQGLLIADIGFAQAILTRDGRIDRIDMILTRPEATQVRDSLPLNLVLGDSLSRQQTMQAMTKGFHINLTAMSLLALLVGVFLIHNTMTFAVVQRREHFAIKRIVGINSKTLLISVLLEAAAISCIASIIGIFLGYILAHALIQLTTQTINDLYFVLHVQDVWFSPWLIVVGLCLGVGSSVLAALLSAIDAAGTSPIIARQRSSIEKRTRKILPTLALLGLITALVGFLLAYVTTQSLILGFLALMLLILGYGLMLPWCIEILSTLCKILLAPLGITASLALGGIKQNISRTGLAIAALCVAVSATFGVDIMIGSFRSSVDQWLNATLQSDVYVTSPSSTSTQGKTKLNPILAEQVKSLAGVTSVSTGLSFQGSTDLGKIELLVVDPHSEKAAKGGGGFEIIGKTLTQPWQSWITNEQVFISEPLATKSRLTPGDNVSILTDTDGRREFVIAAIFRDYESSHGKILLSRPTYNRYWSGNHITTIGVLLDDDEHAESVIDSIRTSLSSAEQPLIIRSNTSIHEESLAIFDRTFEVTRVLRWLTVGIAFVGIFSALLALHLERAREFAILRATGATQLNTIFIVVSQTLFMGLMAGVLALPLGWLMSELLINVINVRSFGWTMQSNVPEGAVLETLLLACSSAILAGLYPAYRLSRSNIANQLRDD